MGLQIQYTFMLIFILCILLHVLVLYYKPGSTILLFIMFSWKFHFIAFSLYRRCVFPFALFQGTCQPRWSIKALTKVVFELFWNAEVKIVQAQKGGQH